MREPFPEESFEQLARDAVGASAQDRAPGFTKCEEVLRPALVEKLFHKDEGDIPDAEVFRYYIPCTLAHPELCAEEDAWCLANIKQAAKSLRRALQGALVGSFHCIRFVSSFVWPCHPPLILHEEISFFSLCYARGSNPVVSVFSPCAFDVRTGLIAVTELEGASLPMHDFVMDVTFLGRVMARSRQQLVREIYVSAAPTDETRLDESADRVFLVQNWRRHFALSEQMGRRRFIQNRSYLIVGLWPDPMTAMLFSFTCHMCMFLLWVVHQWKTEHSAGVGSRSYHRTI